MGTLSNHIVYYLPGMAGMLGRDLRFCAALRKAGVNLVHELNWPRRPWAMQLLNLRDRRTHVNTAEQIAQMIDREPDARRIVLIGHSTGAVIALDTLQRIGKNRVEQTWLLASAVSQDYDLTGSMPGTQKMINLHSRRDWMHLRLGTSLVGSADRRFGACSGWMGFTGPGADSPKLSQHAYNRDWAKAGYRGGHLNVLHEHFADQVIAPAITRGGEL